MNKMMAAKYTNIDNLTWELLIAKRKKNLAQEACSLYLEGLERLKLPQYHVPDCEEMNALISNFTNWRMTPATQLITSSRYYTMLANCQFPAVTDIRPFSAIDYYAHDKPDVIHEFFGHGPFLIHAEFSNCMQRLATLALTFSVKEQALLGRLFWFTIEFGLVQTPDGLRTYGAGIIPSEEETHNALYEVNANRREFNLVDILKTPIIAAQKQKIYYVIDNLETLFALNRADLSNALFKVSKCSHHSEDKSHALP